MTRFQFPTGHEIFPLPPHPDWLWGLVSLLSSGYQGLLSWGEVAGVRSWLLTSFWYQCKECMELYLHSPIHFHSLVLIKQC